ncbi:MULTISPECIES: helix-turn-helix domain-containing protein [Actinomadura]|uniref:Helix-turn-helix domain-containing protein n=1 Tax=Actinomadura geliboluensis TaxID=882440 RepID=A0A5S4G0L4_9ACTN|nr:helix-turn-helix transcriptional regulator [Actinomadura geliboluensis]TMR26392.1 helix-turn-helix domain-containing protein [Actinomadura geliboluensis]
MPRRPRDPGIPSSPTEYFGVELRTYREAPGLSRPQLAEKLGYTPQWIGQIESGKSAPSEDFANDCDSFFETNGVFHRMWKWNQQLERIQVVPPGFRPFIEIEPDATYMRIFEPLLIPGLLQTEEYASKVLEVGHRKEKVEELLAARMARRAILEKEQPPWLLIMLSEIAVRSIAAGPEVMRGQLEYLLDLAQLPHVTLQVVPAGAPVFQAGEIILLSFADRPDVAFADAAGGHGRLIEGSHDVEELVVVFDQVRASALPAEESERLIRRVIEEL